MWALSLKSLLYSKDDRWPRLETLSNLQDLDGKAIRALFRADVPRFFGAERKDKRRM